MNDYLKNGLFLAAGVAIGALGAVALGKGKFSIRPAMADLLSHGMDLKEKTATVLERAKENLDDLMAEAKHAKESREGKSVAEGETA
ncbi:MULTISPECIES: hypothetical protein [Solidesulfovibrio]|uniref:Uncharacterized protein n=2 Tax=Solidesulfovibrio TaxID=2910984 RepID=C4XH20_SOLM1|nr:MULTISPECIES: hypothetical protein [Solidesulfovibrio]QAZ68093.1 hypothetical protein C3Y92_13000 [Solidesulfovibrio carbinolicus]BAH76323.1 hypothetical protein DMR_28320 [Solidesulfovibrio magneticus RS-1]